MLYYIRLTRVLMRIFIVLIKKHPNDGVSLHHTILVISHQDAWARERCYLFSSDHHDAP